MQPTPPRWHEIDPAITYVRAYFDQPPVLDPSSTYSFAALRRVTHPSVSTLADRAVAAAASLDDPSRGGVSSELRDAAASLPPEQCAALRDRSPQAMIPLLKLAGEYLAPLQLLGEVPCVRVYRADLSGSLATSLYRTDLNRHIAPESLLTPDAIGPSGPEVRYLDVLLDQQDRRWPPRTLVLISNARVEPEGYMDIGTKAVSRLAELLVRLPGVGRRELDRAVEVPPHHADWGLALLMRAALGGGKRDTH